MANLFDIKGRVVVMTGACGVLGATIVKYFAAQGCKVVLLDLERAAEKGNQLVAEIKADGGEAMFLPTNVLDQAVLEQNCADIVKAYGSIDILLNAAGGNMGPANVTPEQTIFDLDIDATRKVIDLNTFGTIIPTKVFAKAMVEKGKGSIINFCSMSSFRPLTRVAGYGIAKAGMASWTQWLAGELAIKFGEGLRVNAIAPGFVRTAMTDELPDKVKEQMLAGIPLKRYGEVEDIANAVGFLVSDEASYITGQVLSVDGGMHM